MCRHLQKSEKDNKELLHEYAMPKDFLAMQTVFAKAHRFHTKLEFVACYLNDKALDMVIERRVS